MRRELNHIGFMDIAAGSWSRIRLYIFLRIYLYTGEF